MRTATLATIAAAVVILAGCSAAPNSTTAPAPTAPAQVVGKDEERGKCTYKSQPRTNSAGKKYTVKVPSCKPADYELEVRYADGDVVEHDVSKAEFDRYTIGANYP